MIKIREKKDKGRLIGFYKQEDEIYVIKEGSIEMETNKYMGRKAIPIEDLLSLRVNDERKYMQFETFVLFNGNDPQRMIKKGEKYYAPSSYFFHYASIPYSVKDKRGQVVLVKSDTDYLINHQDDICEFLIFSLTNCLIDNMQTYHVLEVVDKIWVFGKRKKKQVMLMQPIELTLENLLNSSYNKKRQD